MLKAIYVRVLQAQEGPDAIPLTLRPGDPVSTGRPHPDRPGYLWVEDGQVSAGWVPEDLLELADGEPRAKAEYCSAELTVSPGEQLRLIWVDAAHGASWCETPAGDRGWVRQERLRVEEDEAAG